LDNSSFSPLCKLSYTSLIFFLSIQNLQRLFTVLRIVLQALACSSAFSGSGRLDLRVEGARTAAGMLASAGYPLYFNINVISMLHKDPNNTIIFVLRFSFARLASLIKPSVVFFGLGVQRVLLISSPAGYLIRITRTVTSRGRKIPSAGAASILVSRLRSSKACSDTLVALLELTFGLQLDFIFQERGWDRR
jgi:hypothetical protein